MLSNEHEHKHEPLCFVCIALSTCPRRECRRFSGRALVATRRFGYRRNRLPHRPRFVLAAQISPAAKPNGSLSAVRVRAQGP